MWGAYINIPLAGWGGALKRYVIICVSALRKRAGMVRADCPKKITNCLYITLFSAVTLPEN
jgi:hypothetical protein